MNSTISTALLATLGTFMFSLSCFGQDAKFYELANLQKHDHGFSSNEVLDIDKEWMEWIENQFCEIPDMGPLGPGPFLPDPAVAGLDYFTFEFKPVMLARWQNGGFHVEFGLMDISNGFFKIEISDQMALMQSFSYNGSSVIDGEVHGLIDIEDYISKGGGNLMSEAIVMAYRQESRSESGKEPGRYPWEVEELAILILPEDDPDIDPLTGLAIAPWDKDDDGILDQEKELPSDDDRSDHPGDK